MDKVSERGAAKITSRAAPQEIPSEGSGSGNGAGARGVAEAVGLSNELQNSAHQRPADTHVQPWCGAHPCPLCRTSDLTTTDLEHVLLTLGAEMGINAKTSYELLKTSQYLSVLLLNLETCLTMILISKPLVILLQTLYACSASAPCGRY